MKRKDFIKNISLAGIPLMFKGIPVYALEGLTGSALEAFNGITPNSDKILVIIQLNGGNDGLNTVIPLDKYSQLASARANIMLPQSSVLSLDNNSTTGLHPSMSDLRNLYNDGHVAIIQGVSYPNPSFSHFHAQDIWFSGMGVAGSVDTGWLGRGLEKKFPDYPDGYPNTSYPDPPSVQIGGVMPLSLQGTRINMGYNVPNPSDLINIVNASPGDVPDNDYGTELSFLRLMKSQSNVYASNVTASYNAQNTLSVKYPSTGNSLANQLKIVARLIGGGLKTPVYIVNHENSFDTHASQVVNGDTSSGTHATLLNKLSVAIGAFMDDLILMGKANDVIGMTFSEFGRRVINNASLGTDHGTAAPMFVFGTNVNPGMYGTSPDLPDNPNNSTQINTQFDYRQVYTTMMQDWLGISKTNSDTVLNGEYQTINFINKEQSSLENPNSTLPIDAIKLSINQSLKQEEVSFIAYSNHYYEKFQLEISIDGNTFNVLKDIPQITNENLKTYKVTLDRRNEARIYYRIKGISKQQGVSYSNIIVIKNRNKQLLQIYPNPVKDFIFYISFIETPSSNISVEIFDTRGVRLFYNQYTPDKQIVVQVSDMFELHQLHIIKIRFNNEEVVEKIFFK